MEELSCNERSKMPTVFPCSNSSKPKIVHHSKLAPIDNQGLDLIYDNKSYVFAVLDQSAVVETNQGLRFK